MNLIAKVLLAVCLLGISQASAEEGQGVVCDTAAEVEQFVQLSITQSGEAALQAVNAEHGEASCGYVAVIFERGEVVKTIPLKNGLGDITQIIIRAAILNGSIYPMTATQLTVFKAKGYAT